MPQFNLTDQELKDLSEFLEWTSKNKESGLAAKRRGLKYEEVRTCGENDAGRRGANE